MTLGEFLNSEFEEGLEQEVLTYDEIPELAQRVEEDEQQEEAELDIPSVYSSHSMKEKIITIAQVMRILDDVGKI